MPVKRSTKPRRRRDKRSPGRYAAELLGCLAALTLGLWIGLPFLEPQSECITDSWCLSSHEEPLSFAILIVTSLVLGLAATAAGLALAFWMLGHRHARALYGVFFGALGLFGGSVWLAVVPAAERTETVHVPIIAAVSTLAGAALIRSWWRHPPPDTEADTEANVGEGPHPDDS